MHFQEIVHEFENMSPESTAQCPTEPLFLQLSLALFLVISAQISEVWPQSWLGFFVVFFPLREEGSLSFRWYITSP